MEWGKYETKKEENCPSGYSRYRNRFVDYYNRSTCIV